MLDRLEKAGFVKREPNPNDRRSILVHTMPEGMARIHPMYAEINRGLEQLLADYCTKDLDVVIGFFEKANAVRGDRNL